MVLERCVVMGVVMGVVNVTRTAADRDAATVIAAQAGVWGVPVGAGR